MRTCVQILESIQFLSLRFVYTILDNQIAISHRVLLEKLTVPQIFEPVTCSYPELGKNQPRLSHPHYLKLILLRPPFTSRSSKWSHPFKFPQQTPVCVPFLPMHAAIPTHLTPLVFGSSNHIALPLSKIPLHYFLPLMQGATFCANLKYFCMFLDGKWEEQIFWTEEKRTFSKPHLMFIRSFLYLSLHFFLHIIPSSLLPKFLTLLIHSLFIPFIPLYFIFIFFLPLSLFSSLLQLSCYINKRIQLSYSTNTHKIQRLQKLLWRTEIRYY